MPEQFQVMGGRLILELRLHRHLRDNEVNDFANLFDNSREGFSYFEL